MATAVLGSFTVAHDVRKQTRRGGKQRTCGDGTCGVGFVLEMWDQCLFMPALMSKQGTHAFLMATTRSRTGLFLSYRESQAPRRRSRTHTFSYDAAQYDDDENEQLIQNNHVVIHVPILPPKWSIFRPLTTALVVPLNPFLVS
jgi:hypothetical protein